MNILKMLRAVIEIDNMLMELHPMSLAEARFNHPNAYPAPPEPEKPPAALSDDDEEEEDYETPFQQMCAKHALQRKIDECIDDIKTAEANRIAGKILRRLGE